LEKRKSITDFVAVPPINDQMSLLESKFSFISGLLNNDQKEGEETRSFLAESDYILKNAKKIIIDCWNEFKSSLINNDGERVDITLNQLSLVLKTVNQSLGKLCESLENQIVNSINEKTADPMIPTAYKFFAELSGLYFSSFIDVIDSLQKTEVEQYIMTISFSFFEAIHLHTETLTKIITDYYIIIFELSVDIDHLLMDSLNQVLMEALSNHRLAYRYVASYVLSNEEILNVIQGPYKSLFSLLSSSEGTNVEPAYRVKLFSNVLASLTLLWGDSHKLQDEILKLWIGELVCEFVELETNQRLFSVPITKLSDLFSVSIKFGDSATAEKIKDLLISDINRVIEEIHELCDEAFSFVANGPNYETQEMDTGDNLSRTSRRSLTSKKDEPITQMFISDIEKLSSSLKEHSDIIVSVLSESLKSMSMLSSMCRPNANNEEEMENEQPNAFNAVDGQLRDCLVHQIDKIETILQENRKVRSNKIGSVVSVNPKTVNSQYSPLQIRGFKILVISLREAFLVNLRQHMLLSIKDGSFDYQELQKFSVDFMSLLNEAKIDASERANIKEMQKIDDIISRIQNDKIDIVSAVESGFVELIEMEMIYYKQSLEEVTQQHQEILMEIQTQLDEKFQQKEQQVHIPQLVLLEKQIFIGKNREELRPVIEAERKEKEATKLASMGQYEKAHALMKETEIIREKEIDKRLKALEVKFDKLKHDLLGKQMDELSRLEALYQKRIDNSNVQLQKEISKIETALITRIEIHKKQIIAHATKCMASTNVKETKTSIRDSSPRKKESNTKSEIIKRLDSITFSTLMQYKLQHLIPKKLK